MILRNTPIPGLKIIPCSKCRSPLPTYVAYVVDPTSGIDVDFYPIFFYRASPPLLAQTFRNYQVLLTCPDVTYKGVIFSLFISANLEISTNGEKARLFQCIGRKVQFSEAVGLSMQGSSPSELLIRVLLKL